MNFESYPAAQDLDCFGAARLAMTSRGRHCEPKAKIPGRRGSDRFHGIGRLVPLHSVYDSLVWGLETAFARHWSGAAFHSALRISHAVLVLRKGFRADIDSYSTFYENDRSTPTGLVGYLRERGLTRVILAGLAFHFCVRFSAEDARREGFDVVVVEDACRGIDVEGSVAATRQSFAERSVLCAVADAVD